MILYQFLDRILNGVMREWIERNFIYTEWIPLGDAAVDGYYIQTVNWWNLKRKLFTGLLILVAAVVVLVRTVSILYASRQVKAAMRSAGRMIEDYMRHDREALEVFPQGYEEISVRIVEIKADMQRKEQMLREEASRKNDLITYLAHDLKTPLTSVIGYLSLMDEAPDMPASQRAKYVHITLDKALRLEKFRTAELQRLDLDLREKLNVKSEAAALGDLRRSFFLHRLRVLGVHFANLLPSRQDGANWGEYWELRWTPEAEIEIVESALMGDTIEGAAAFALKERADNSSSIAQAAAIFQDAFLCGMPAAAAHALSVLQGLSVDSAAVSEVAETASRLSLVVRYGDLRRFDPAPVVPLIKQLYLRACLTLADACVCDAKSAPAVTQAMDRLNALQLNHEFLEEGRWLELLADISDRDDLNTRCSGFAMAILLERGKADEALLSREVARRLSPGVPADLGAGWFEGLAGKNRYALIARLSLWRQLDEYLSGLDDETFRRALVFLRRAFADFSPNEKNDIAENLGEIWGVNTRQAAELLMNDVTETEQAVLDSLDEFDFDDI